MDRADGKKDYDSLLLLSEITRNEQAASVHSARSQGRDCGSCIENFIWLLRNWWPLSVCPVHASFRSGKVLELV